MHCHTITLEVTADFLDTYMKMELEDNVMSLVFI